ncbi:site-specific integrase [Salicibibacter halophilus]|uniref:Site-specific integrase n=1 Tax=Salicibibacter halophilus TaxID=2502791 RepID=A0A514LGT6_9BACI|nr:N-terminal phage integrase SAM-like domain-containing protein [Salicibibacter halophilus]QDI91068.1 site-specific integrase [Salicibibacter halophilus]
MGYIEKRRNNKYRLNVVIGYTDKKKKIYERRMIEAKNQTEAKKKLAKFESEILSGHYIRPDKMLLKDFYVNEWLEKYAPERFGVNTLHEMQSIIEKRILPKFGAMAISEFQTIHIVNFIEDLKKDGRRLDGKLSKLSASSITNCYKAINTLFHCAEKYGLIQSKPAKGVETPSTTGRKVQLNYSSEMLWNLIECIKHEPKDKQLLFWIAFVTSAREAEIVALEEKHILADRQAIFFEQSLYEKKGGGVGVKAIKNHLEGTAAVPPELMHMIQGVIHEKRQEKMKMRDRWQYQDTLFLFGDIYGKPLRPDGFSRWWRKFITKNNLEKYVFMTCDIYPSHF